MVRNKRLFTLVYKRFWGLYRKRQQSHCVCWAVTVETQWPGNAEYCYTWNQTVQLEPPREDIVGSGVQKPGRYTAVSTAAAHWKTYMENPKGDFTGDGEVYHTQCNTQNKWSFFWRALVQNTVSLRRMSQSQCRAQIHSPLRKPIVNLKKCLWKHLVWLNVLTSLGSKL